MITPFVICFTNEVDWNICCNAKESMILKKRAYLQESFLFVLQLHQVGLWQRRLQCLHYSQGPLSLRPHGYPDHFLFRKFSLLCCNCIFGPNLSLHKNFTYWHLQFYRMKIAVSNVWLKNMNKHLGKYTSHNKQGRS